MFDISGYGNLVDWLSRMASMAIQVRDMGRVM